MIEESRIPFEGGPFLTVACICERVLREQDGVLSLIRVVDRFIVTGTGPDAPEDMPPHEREFSIVIIVKSGTYHGSATVRIVPEHPTSESGGALEQGEAIETTFLLEGDERGHQITSRIRERFTIPGLYWFSVYLNNYPVTRIPLRVMYQRTSTVGPPGGS